MGVVIQPVRHPEHYVGGTMAFSILNVIDNVEGPDENGRYRVYLNTTKAFPAAIARIRELAKDASLERNTAERPVIDRLFSDNPITDKQWKDALTPLADIDPDEYARIRDRAQALETALGFIMRSVKLMMIATGRPDYDTTTSRDIAYKLYYPLER
jgi:hypothetical protein